MAKVTRKKQTFSLDDPSTQEQRNRYAQDRRAYYRDCLRVRDRTGKGIVPLELNPGQAALENLRDHIEEFHQEMVDYIRETTGKEARREPVRMLVLKARRVGFSTAIAAQMFHYCEHNKAKNGLVVAHMTPNANNIAQISRRFSQQFPSEYEHLKIPMWKEGEEIEWGDVDNQPWDSRIIIATASSKNFARSFEYSFVHLSECAHYKTPDAIASAKDAAMFAEYIYEESTANGMDPYFYQSWQNAMYLDEVRSYWRKHRVFPDGWNGKYKFFWAWWQDDAYQVSLSPAQAERVMASLSDKELDGVRKFQWVPEQIEWRRRKIAGDCSEQSLMDPEDYFNQEYPSEPDDAFVSTGKTVFPTIILAKAKTKSLKNSPRFHGFVIGYDNEGAILQKAKKDLYDSSHFVTWDDPNPKSQYIIGARAAEGLKHTDWSVAIVFDRTNGTLLREVASYRGQCTGIELGDICVWLGKKYNNAYIIPEATNPTTALRIVSKKYPNLYQRKNEEKVGLQTNTDAFVPGFKCWRHYRQMVINHAQDAFRKEEMDIKSKWWIDEHLHFVNDDGTMAAPAGQTDDGVMCTAMAIFAHRETAPLLRSRVVEESKYAHLDENDRAWAEAIEKKKTRAMRKNRQLARATSRKRKAELSKLF